VFIDSSWKGYGKMVGSLNSWRTKNWFKQNRLLETFWWYGARRTNESAGIDVESSTEDFRQTDIWTNCNCLHLVYIVSMYKVQNTYFNCKWYWFIEDGGYFEAGMECERITFPRYILWSFYFKIQLIYFNYIFWNYNVYMYQA